MADEELIEDEWVLWGSYPSVRGHTTNPFTGQSQPIKSAYVGREEWQRAHDFLRAAGAVPVGNNRHRVSLGDSFVELRAAVDYTERQNTWGVAYPDPKSPAAPALFDFFFGLLNAGSFILEQRDSQLKPMVTSAETKARIGELFSHAVVVTSAADMIRLRDEHSAALHAEYGDENPFTGS